MVRVRYHKQAEPAMTPERDLQNRFLAELVRNVGRFGLGALAVGGGVRSLQALTSGELWGRSEAAPPTDALIRPHPVRVPAPAYGDPTIPRPRKHRELLAAAGIDKVAGDDLPFQSVLPYYTANPSQDSAFFAGPAGHHLSEWHVPWYYPAAGAAIGAGAYAGYKGVGSVFDAFRKSRREADVSEAEGRFRSALDELQGESPPPSPPTMDVVVRGRPRRVRALPEGTTGSLPPHYRDVVGFPEKKASPTLAGSLDRLVKAALAKEAMNWGDMTPLLTAYLTGAVPVALGTGALTYQHFAAQDPDKLLADAVRRRARSRWLSRPPEVYAAPVPHSPGKSQLQFEAPAAP